MKNVLLYGQGSYDNRGCEAIVVSTAKQIKEVGDRKIISATFDYKKSKSKHNDLIDKYVNHYYKENELKENYKKLNEYYKSIPFDYMNFEKLYQHEVIDEIKKCDICLSIGGDNYCYGYSRWLYAINDEIRKQNKKNVLWCASLYEELTDEDLINDMKNFDVIMAREPITYRALQKYIDKKRLLLVPDPAFSLEPKKVKLNNIFKKNVIGINVSPLVLKDDSKTYESIVELIKYILDNLKCNIALIPHVFLEESNDLDVLNKLKNDFIDDDRVVLINDKKYDCGELKYIISNCQFMIAARTHASIAAYSSCVPTLVIGYSVKSKGIAEYLFGDYKDYVIPYNDLTPSSLNSLFKQLYVNRNDIKKHLEYKMKRISKEAKKLYYTLETTLNKLDQESVTLDSYCTGCGACLNKCPFGAITMRKNKDGFKYPIINKKKCTNCGLCKKVCPCNNSYTYKYDYLNAYAAYNKNDEFFNKSSSGAIFPLLSKKLLQKKWVVYGCFFNGNAKHIRIDSLDKLDKILGSKYVQSDTSFTFQSVKKDLENKNNVLYSGVPCQIEGLKRYLGKEYKNLYCVSVICHGVPSIDTLNKYLSDTFKTYHKININFRYKKDGLSKIRYILDKKEYFNNSENDLYMKAFLKNYSLRNSCYKCEYKLFKKNSSDIILGDYWGYQNYHDLNNKNKNVSAIIINSDKGKKLFDYVTKDICYESTDIQNIINGNPLLINVVKYNKFREEFLDKIKTQSFDKVIANVEHEEEFLNNKNYIKTLEEDNMNLKRINEELKYELNQKANAENDLLNSKKWKLATLIFDPIIKLKNKIRSAR